MPDSDLELLSAYIDDQLPAPERADLERRLGTEPRLGAELADLRATASLLRALDPLPPPRSFALDPATAPRRGFMSFGWAMQLGGGLAGFALVLLASLQLLVGVGGGAAASAPAPAAMMETAPMAAAPAATAAPMIAAAEMAPETTADAPMAAAMAPEGTQDASAARNATESAASDAGGATEAYEAAEVPSAEISASGSSSPDTGSLELPAPPAAKAAPQPAGLPASLILGLGILLMAAALGSFLYGRARR